MRPQERGTSTLTQWYPHVPCLASEKWLGNRAILAGLDGDTDVSDERQTNPENENHFRRLMTANVSQVSLAQYRYYLGYCLVEVISWLWRCKIGGGNNNWFTPEQLMFAAPRCGLHAHRAREGRSLSFIPVSRFTLWSCPIFTLLYYPRHGVRDEVLGILWLLVKVNFYLIGPNIGPNNGIWVLRQKVHLKINSLSKNLSCMKHNML